MPRLQLPTKVKILAHFSRLRPHHREQNRFSCPACIEFKSVVFLGVQDPNLVRIGSQAFKLFS